MAPSEGYLIYLFGEKTACESISSGIINDILESVDSYSLTYLHETEVHKNKVVWNKPAIENEKPKSTVPKTPEPQVKTKKGDPRKL